MNVLWVTYGLPYPPHSGARARDFYLLRELGTQHRVTCVCLMEADDTTENLAHLEEFGITVYGFPVGFESTISHAAVLVRHIGARRPLATYALWNERMFACVRELVTTGAFDVVQIEHSMMMAYRDAVPANFHGKTVLDLHNVGERQYQRMRRMGHGARERALFWLKARAMQNWEVTHATRFDRVLTVSNEDAAWLRARNPALQVEVVENGVDTDERRCLKETEGNCQMLFVGTLGYPPNEDAVLWFCAEILPLIRQVLPQVEFVIAGRAPRERVRALASQSGVQVHMNVSDLGPLYERAQVVVVPLRAGGGTRLKILEAMAYGRAVVSTPIGSEGLDVADGETILLADTPQEFAAAVIRLLRDDAARKQLARNARRLVEQRYKWKQIGARLLQIYNELSV